MLSILKTAVRSPSKRMAEAETSAMFTRAVLNGSLCLKLPLQIRLDRALGLMSLGLG